MKGGKLYDEINEDSLIRSSMNDESKDNSKYNDNNNIRIKSNLEMNDENKFSSNEDGDLESQISDIYEEKQTYRDKSYSKEITKSGQSEEKRLSKNFRSSTDSNDRQTPSDKGIEKTQKNTSSEVQLQSYIKANISVKSNESQVKEKSNEDYEEEEDEDEEESYESEEEASDEKEISNKTQKTNQSHPSEEYEEEESGSDEESEEDESEQSDEISNRKNEINRKSTYKIEIPNNNKVKKVRIVKKKYKNKIKNQNKYNDDGQANLDSLFPNEELNKIQTPFTVDIVKLADECFDIYQVTVKNRNFRLIDINEVQNLLDVVGIKKNLYEIRNCIFDLKRTKKFRVDEKYTKQNFLDIVDYFRNYRIDDRLLAEVYRFIDEHCDGYMTYEDILNISRAKKLNFSDEEINDILYFFELEDIVKCEMQNKNYAPSDKSYFNFEKFCRLYYQG